MQEGIRTQENDVLPLIGRNKTNSAPVPTLLSVAMALCYEDLLTKLLLA